MFQTGEKIGSLEHPYREPLHLVDISEDMDTDDMDSGDDGFKAKLSFEPETPVDIMECITGLVRRVDTAFLPYLEMLKTAVQVGESVPGVDYFHDLRMYRTQIDSQKRKLEESVFEPFSSYVERYGDKISKFFGERFHIGLSASIAECLQLLQSGEDAIQFFKKMLLQWKLLKTEILEPGWLSADMQVVSKVGDPEQDVLNKSTIILYHCDAKNGRDHALKNAFEGGRLGESYRKIVDAVRELNTAFQQDTSFTRRNFDLIRHMMEVLSKGELGLFCKYENDEDQPMLEKMVAFILQEYGKTLQRYKEEMLQKPERQVLSGSLAQIADIFSAAQVTLESVLGNFKKTKGAQINEFDCKRVEHVLTQVLARAFPVVKSIVGGIRQYVGDEPMRGMLQAYEDLTGAVKDGASKKLPKALMEFSKQLSMFDSEYRMLVHEGFFSKKEEAEVS
ncbi:hypothetical protein HYW82_02315 [Candidatus Peregrinibacteria bacterium]|nr:hypothetical protein [Candidatus Peregrinibacteria bacterium]